MRTNQIIASLCYFSIFFATFLFPLAVYFIVDDREVRGHAKIAMLTHLIPFFLVPIVVISLIANPSMGVAFIAVIMLMLASFATLIWNIVKGIKVLKA
ncbi:hypothetical protein EJF36_17835 [Bacillus sp. HMF5848]|uniref:hypothetical protein n=1 Tax=Bacillus sp. HMF5848 TaxID=2495421 RepID=UPI000F7B6695|nr:hypothetical protein [Bacillus sp. HMF5848]RSK28577.1 hypothetical protein EJF36_17835 [Bacillus sp. HMF5848]